MGKVNQAARAFETIRQMIDGESALDLKLMRRCARDLCDDGALDELVGSLELLDVAQLFAVPPATLSSLRDEAKRKLNQASTIH